MMFEAGKSEAVEPAAQASAAPAPHPARRAEAGLSGPIPAMEETRHHSPRSAFTLIEVLITLVILATGIVLVLRAFQTSAVALADSRNALRGVELLQRSMAQAEAGDPLAAGAVSVPGGGEWMREVARTPAAFGGSNRLEQVTITVWPQGSSHRLSVSGYIHRP